MGTRIGNAKGKGKGEGEGNREGTQLSRLLPSASILIKTKLGKTRMELLQKVWHIVFVLFLLFAVAYMSRNDPDGFDPVADTVGAGIYSGQVIRDDNGNLIIGKQYMNHNPTPGPVYNGKGFTEMSKAIHNGPDSVKQLIESNPALVKDIATGGATPLHTCGMSQVGQLSTKLLIDHGADIEAVDTYGYTPLHRMASNNLEIGAQMLIDAGANIERPTGMPYTGDTAWSIARMSNARKVMQVLMKYKKV
jgi:hypothetical protein